MSVIAAVNGGNDPFAGGSITRTGQANVAGAIGSANTSVSNPISGVNAGTPFFARNNQGSNIPIPYSRLVPLGTQETSAIGLPPGIDATSVEGLHMKKVVKETEDLRPTTVGFILGKRSGESIGSVGADDRGVFNGNGSNGTNGLNNDYGFALGVNTSLAPQMRGTERFQKLCSMDYLQRYFTNVLCYKKIDLSMPITQAMVAGWDEGVRRMVKALADTKDLQRGRVANGNEDAVVGTALNLAPANTTVQNYVDVAKQGAYVGSAAAAEPTIHQGVFTRDTGPFLRGKGVEPYMTNAVANMAPFEIVGGGANGNSAFVHPFSMNRCLGDEVAFAQLEAWLTSVGVTDWRPDGIVLSKGVNDPSDKMTDEMLEARDGQLFNVRIQGPAITSSWTGDPALETMPLDKVFVVVVADTWWGDDPSLGTEDEAKFGGAANKTAILAYLAAANPTSAQVDAYVKARDKMISASFDRNDGDGQPAVDKDYLEGTDWKALQEQNYKNSGTNGQKNAQKTRLCNFRVILATSSQMINYSYVKFEGSGDQMAGSRMQAGNAYRKVYGQSRMGLKLCRLFGEYIVGGWCIGNVLDTAASRGSMPGSGSNIGARTAPNSMALNINVHVEWWDADKMWRSFMNKDGLLTPRYQQTKQDFGNLADNDVNKRGLSKANMPPSLAIGLGDLAKSLAVAP